MLLKLQKMEGDGHFLAEKTGFDCSISGGSQWLKIVTVTVQYVEFMIPNSVFGVEESRACCIARLEYAHENAIFIAEIEKQ